MATVQAINEVRSVVTPRDSGVEWVRVVEVAGMARCPKCKAARRVAGFVRKSRSLDRFGNHLWVNDRDESWPELACGCGSKTPPTILRIVGRVTGHRCDARCLNGTGHVCECSCGGRNHGRNH
jgi:hypothetical protein